MKQQKYLTIFLIAATIFLGLTYLPLLGSERTVDTFAREDGVFENLTSLYLFLTFLVFAACLFYFRKASWLLKLSFAGLALLFFLGAGEEISWGERIFHWDDHNLIRGVNVQNELTIHNLKYFQGDEAVIPVSASQVFTAFAFIFTVLIPLACKLSPKLEKFVAPIFPVLPLYVGVLVVATYVFQKAMVRLLPMFPALYHHPSMPIPQGVHEIREHGYAFALLAAALLYYLRERAAQDAAHRKGASGILANPGPVMPIQIDNKGEKI